MSETDNTQYQPGTMIGGTFEVISTISIGDNTGYLCTHKLVGKKVLLKCLMSTSPNELARFQHEAKCMSSISSPNVLSVQDFGIAEGGFPYLVMEYIDGESLAAILQRDGTLTLDRFRNLFAQSCDALSAVHARGIVHRDIKPANFLISRTDKGDERVSLMEFTVAKTMPKPETERLTLAGEILGTPPYMSPEMCTGLPLDHRADIYALGCCMFEAISGTSPFLGATTIDTMSRHVSEIPRLPIEDKPEFACMEFVVSRCLEKKPEDRFASAADLKKALVGNPVKNKPSESLRGLDKIKNKLWPF